MNTDELIATLSKEKSKPQLKTPIYYAVRLLAVLVAYGVGAQLVLGLRDDLLVQFMRPMFALEILLLVLLTGLSAWVAVLSMYPDIHQKPRILSIPYVYFFILSAFILFQLAMPENPMMVMPESDTHGMECALCIASVSIIPSTLIFGFLRKGASIHPLRSGSFAVFAATGIGCLTLRLAEANDSLMHLAVWHYLPTLMFAGLGALIGRYLLRW